MNNSDINSKERPSLTGQRVTSQRRLLLSLLREADRHLDADELYRLAREKEPRLSLSTVYRALRLFKELGLVDEVHFDEAHHHYEVKPQVEHHHLVCLGCGKVIEFHCPLTQQMRDDIGREMDFEITGAEVRMEGYCRACRQRKP